MNRTEILAKRILLVEDELADLQRFRLFLSRAGHTVVEANNGAEAMVLFRSSQFDLVITDDRLPFVSGHELATKIKELAPWQPILMLSAYTQRPSADNPADALLHKCCDWKRFCDVINELFVGVDLESSRNSSPEAELVSS